MAKKQDVAVKEQAGLPAAYDYGEDSGVGFDGTTSAELSIPFIGVLQANSPQVEDETVEGAKSGMLFNTVTSELYDPDVGVVLLPVKREHAFVEWTPRDQGGGMVGRHDPDSQVVRDAIEAVNGDVFNNKLTYNGNDLVDTFYMYNLVLDATGAEVLGFAVVSFSSTKIKSYKSWFTSMMSIRGKPPMFANRAVLRTIKQKNEKGSFYNFRISPLKGTWAESLINPATESHLLDEAKGFMDLVNSGAMTAAYDTERSAGDTPAPDSEDPPF